MGRTLLDCFFATRKRESIDHGGHDERPGVATSQQKAAVEKSFAAAFDENRAFVRRYLAIEVLADRSWMWCKARDRADNPR